MPESLDAFAELSAIRARLEGIENRQEMLVRAQADNVLEAIWQYVDDDAKLGEVYLLVDGRRRQQDIMDELQAKGISASRSTVSRKLTILSNEMGLIDIVDRTSAGITYQKSELDRILNLSPRIEGRLADNSKQARRGRQSDKS